MSPFILLLLLSAAFAIPYASAHRSQHPPIPASDLVGGLAYDFYHESCPHAESIVRSAVSSFLAPNISQAGALIRLVFHDCFVQGCDASVLLTNGELSGPPDLTLRPEALALIEQIKELLEQSCPNTVSCADAVVLAGRDATYKAGGPFFDVPTGRLDSLAPASVATVDSDLPPPTANFSFLIGIVNKLGLTSTDLVALSGAHTIGLAHCASFNNSILPTVQNDVDASFAQTLLQVCPNDQSNQETVQDYVTPNLFDNQYYKNLLHKEVLFDSDRALLDDEESAATVAAFAANQQEFFEQFAVSFVKMSMVAVRTATTNPSNGNIRKVCSALNAANATLPGVTMLYTAKDTLGDTQ